MGVTYGGSEGNAFTLNNPIAGKIKDAVIRGSEMVLRSALPYAAAARSAGGGDKAFKEATKWLVQNMLDSFSKRLEVQLLYGQSGIGKVSAVSGQVLTIETAEWAPGIWAGAEDMKIDIATVASGLTVTKVDLKARTVELASGAVTGMIGKDIVYNGAGGKEFAGLHKIITNTGTLFGIDAAEFNLFKGNSVAITGSLQLANIEEAVAKGVEKGLARDVVCLVNVNSWTDLLTEQAAKRQYDSSYSSKEMENGAKTLKFHGQNGMIEVVPSIYVKEGQAFVMCPDEFLRIGSSDITFKRPGKGDEFFRELENAAGYELRAYTDQALFCYKPGLNTIITGINS